MTVCVGMRVINRTNVATVLLVILRVFRTPYCRSRSRQTSDLNSGEFSYI